VRRWLFALGLLAGLALGQKQVITVYYDFNDPSPGRLWFDNRATIQDAALDARKMACGALYDPSPQPLGASDPKADVNYLAPLPQLLGCQNPWPFTRPQAPGDPVIALGRDPQQSQRYLTIGIFFGGNGADPGLGAIHQALKNHYVLRIRLTGDLNRVDLEAARGLRTPGAVPWGQVRWQTVSNPLYVGFTDPPEAYACLWVGFRWCHYGEWALPLRLRVHGSERGKRKLQLTLDEIVQQIAALSVQSGRLKRLELAPAKPSPRPRRR